MFYTIIYEKMKKILWLWLFISALVLAGCNFKTGTSTDNGWSNYEWELVIQWVGPEISMEPTVEEWTLVLRWSFEDQTDHVFLKKWARESLFESENEYLPWNTVKFKWYVEPLDAAAGNHYYDVVNIESLDIISNPDANWVKDILEWWNYCETDNDCMYIAWECPFGCYVPLNNNFADIAWKILDNYFDVNGKNCVYDCLYMDKVVCENYKCTMIASDENWATEITDEHSNNTLIISMIEWTDQDMIEKYLLNKYDMEILYDYENFNTIAVKFDHEMTEEELDKTISEIEKVGFVIRVEKDYISHINN